MGTIYGREVVGEHPLADQEAVPDWEGPSVVLMSRNPSVGKGEVWLRGHPVPYVEVFKVPVDSDGEQVFPIKETQMEPSPFTPIRGGSGVELSLDRRWSFDFDTAHEAARVAAMMADAMAVATGRACHGSRNRLDPHGPITTEPEQHDPAPAVSEMEPKA